VRVWARGKGEERASVFSEGVGGLGVVFLSYFVQIPDLDEAVF
jgi:hypothetical protein